MTWFLMFVAAVHAAFTLGELFPWSCPLLLRVISRKLPGIHDGRPWTTDQQRLVATIVRNAGIYNAILAGGLFWAALAGTAGEEPARVLLVGVAAAGVFGTVTLKSPITALQALLGIAGVALL